MKFAYAKLVSVNGLVTAIEDQIAQLKIAGYDELVVEKFTSYTTKRPKLDALIQHLQHGDMIIVTKLDRLARTTAEGSKLIRDLLNRGVSVHILNMGLIDNTPTGKLITHILLAFAEYERDLIIERTQAGKEIARSKEGFREGEPLIDQKKRDFAADLILSQRKSYNEAVELMGLSKLTILRPVCHDKAKRILAEVKQ